MSSPSSRRSFLQFAAVGSLAAGLSTVGVNSVVAMEPLNRKGKARMKLGLAAYSFRDYFKHSNRGQKGKVEESKKIDMFDFIDYCADHGCDGAELTSYYFPQDATPDYMLKIKRHAFLRGISISGSSVGNNFALPKGPERDKQIADVKQWIDMCAVMGAPHIRVFAGPVPKAISAAEAQKLCIAALEECCDYAGKKGIFLGLENHGGIVEEPEAMLEIVRAINHPFFGVNFDSGNFYGDDPYAGLAKIAPYTVNAQLKVEIRRGKERKIERADLGKVVRILRDAGYQGYVVLEYEEAADPFVHVPKVLKEIRSLIEA